MEKESILQHGALSIPVRINASDFGIQRVVLAVHGLGSNSMDMLQTSIAEEMEFFNSAVYRFDFPAHGTSPLESECFTLESCRQSLIAAAEYARKSHPEVADFCIFASGFGAYVTLTCMEDLLNLVGRIRLVLQAPSLQMHQTLLFITQTTKATLEAMGHMRIPCQRPLDVGFEFYRELEKNTVINAYPIPMLVLHREQDPVVSREDIQNFARNNEQSKLVLIPGSAHHFLDSDALGMVLDLTRDWFEFEQVLLSDWS